MKRKQILFSLLTVILFASCLNSPKENTKDKVENYMIEKKAIINVINNETKAAFQRDYESWKTKWVHDSNISKSYMNFVDGSYSESIGWNEINSFVKTYIKEHPEPDTLPIPIEEIDMRLFENGAWVIFEQQDPKTGLKRETRLMEKVNGKWKIAGMHTSIYGFKKE